MSVAAVVIGRNEGARLKRCLASLKAFSPVIYVDSGSTDGSVEAARATGADVVTLDAAFPFTAARARNAGLARLSRIAPDTPFVQMIDGDCEMREGWIETARSALEKDEGLAGVAGRRRERHPEASLWNALTDAEWDTPVGPATAVGGDAVFRRTALAEVGGYPDDMIAGEEPEMCYRMRQAGWRLARIDAEMTLHDAAMTRFGQWWQRNRRAGHAFAESAARHPGFRRTETLRALVWGAFLPLITLLGVLATPWALLLVLAYPLQCMRLYARRIPWARAVFLTIGKFPEAQGVLSYWWGRVRGQRQALIEYK